MKFIAICALFALTTSYADVAVRLYPYDDCATTSHRLSPGTKGGELRQANGPLMEANVPGWYKGRSDMLSGYVLHLFPDHTVLLESFCDVAPSELAASGKWTIVESSVTIEWGEQQFGEIGRRAFVRTQGLCESLSLYLEFDQAKCTRAVYLVSKDKDTEIIDRELWRIGEYPDWVKTKRRLQGARLRPRPNRAAGSASPGTPAVPRAVPAEESSAGGEVLIVSFLTGRQFTICDDFAGQDVVFKRRGESMIAVWRILGSGVPTISEIDCELEIQGSRGCVFEVQPRNAKRSKVRVELRGTTGLRFYVNGVRIYVEEREPRPAPKPVASMRPIINFGSPWLTTLENGLVAGHADLVRGRGAARAGSLEVRRSRLCRILLTC